MYLYIMLIFILFFGCNHPESKTYERNQKSRYASQTSETGNKSNLNDTFNEKNKYTSGSVFKGGERNAIPMEVRNGVRYVWIEINGIKLKFIFDTGASSICISSAEAVVLFRQGLLREEDIIGSQSFQDATGRISEGAKINLREVKIGDIILKNIEATVIDNVNAPLLLGQTVFERFGKIEIDNGNNEIIFK